MVYFGFVFAASSIGTFYFSFGLLEKHIYNHKLIMQTCIYTKEKIMHNSQANNIKRTQDTFIDCLNRLC